MSATWLFDLGNTRLKFAPLQADGRVGQVQAINHVDATAAFIDALPEGDLAVLASVGPQAMHAELMLALVERFGRIELARTQSTFAGLRIAYARPSRLGVDRWLALLAVHARGQGAALLVGVGTALTVDLVDGDGHHHGGLIAPSPELMREALHARIRQLPAAGGDVVDFADNTEDALAGGSMGAALGLVERSQASAAQRLGRAPALLLHGGGATALAAQLPSARLCEGLVLDGLAVWARHGQG